MALNQHVYIFGQPQEKPAAFPLCNIQGDAAFVGVESKEQGAAVGMRPLAYKGRFMPCRVSHSRRLDLYSGRTLIGQELGAVGPGEGPRQLQHLHVI